MVPEIQEIHPTKTLVYSLEMGAVAMFSEKCTKRYYT